MPAFQVYLIHTMSFLFMAVSFIAKMLETVTLIFGLDHPLVLIRRAQATAIIISFSFFKYDFIQAHGLKTITLVYISFFNALSRTHTLNLITTLRAFSWILFIASDTNSVWLVQLWAQSIWSLLEYGSTSITFIGRRGLLLIGHLLRLLLLNLWNIGLINVKTLQHDAGTGNSNYHRSCSRLFFWPFSWTRQFFQPMDTSTIVTTEISTFDENSPR